MGIRFLCPNGHRLNVKSHLAGMRGICPDCDARFVIPTESGGAVEAAAPEAITAETPPPVQPVSDTVPQTQPATQAVAPPPVPAPTPSPPVPAPAPAALPDLWYVNTAGQQFGPANTETFQSWITAGRVPADALVWRTGWTEWKSGSEVLKEFEVPPAPPLESAPAVEPEVSASAVPTDNYHARQRRRRDRAKLLTMSLSALVFLLLVVLVVVLVRD